jgi:hypothetical protein
MGTSRYQLLPPLSPDEYAALKADIAEHGVMVAVEVDEDGNLLDGHHRAAIAAELGIDYPTVVRAGLTEEQKLEHALRLNLQRRHLSLDQRRELVRAELDRDPNRSDRAIARLTGVDHKTVGKMRRDKTGGEFPTLAWQDQWRVFEAGINRHAAALAHIDSDDWDDYCADAGEYLPDLLADMSVLGEWDKGPVGDVLAIAEAVDLMPSDDQIEERMREHLASALEHLEDGTVLATRIGVLRTIKERMEREVGEVVIPADIEGARERLGQISRGQVELFCAMAAVAAALPEPAASAFWAMNEAVGARVLGEECGNSPGDMEARAGLRELADVLHFRFLAWRLEPGLDRRGGEIPSGVDA